MKLIKYLSFLLPLFMVGCETTEGLNIDEVVTSSTESISFTIEGGKEQINFFSYCDWEASVSEGADWLTLNDNSGPKGSNYISVTAAENKSIESREAVITIYNSLYDLYEEIAVFQEECAPYITLSSNALEFNKNKSSKSIEVESNIPWSAKIESNADWLSITPAKGDDGTTTIEVTVKDNKTVDNRSANISIENSEYKLSQVLTIQQGQGDVAVSVSTSAIDVPAEGSKKSVKIESNVDWKAECDASWVSLYPSSGKKGESSLEITVDANPYTEIRSTTVIIRDSKQKELAKISVTQGDALPYINVYTTEIEAPVEGLIETITIESNTAWEIKYDTDRVSVSSFDGEYGISTVDVTVLPNRSKESNTVLNICAKGQSETLATINVTQDVPYINLDTPNITEPSDTYTINVDSNIQWTAEYDANIVSVTPDYGIGGEDVTITLIRGTVETIDILFCNNDYGVSSKLSLKLYGSNNLIRYTTSDGEVVTPADVTGFGANIISNNYESGVGFIVFDGDVTAIGYRAFYNCPSLTSITIPDSVTTIGGYAFEYCYSLTSITIPDSVTTIGDYAFCDCDSLTSVIIPDSVTMIGGYAFYDCGSLTSVTIGDSVTTIGDYAFRGCSSLTSVTIGDSVTKIGDVAFANCTNLISITIPDSVTTIGMSAFFNCDCLTSVTIPDSVTTIGPQAFTYCDSLTSVTIGDSVTKIGYSAFYGCGLTSVTIPDSVTTIEDEAFGECFSLTSVTIGDSVNKIGYRAFYYCSSLTSVTIPDSVTTIGDAAFYCCSSLTSVYCETTTPPSLGGYYGGYYVFDHNASGRKIYVPVASVNAYKRAFCWSEYADAIVGYDFENGEVVE